MFANDIEQRSVSILDKIHQTEDQQNKRRSVACWIVPTGFSQYKNLTTDVNVT